MAYTPCLYLDSNLSSTWFRNISFQYFKGPLGLATTITDKSSFAIKIRLVAENLGDIPITFVNMTYSLLENVNKLTDGCIAFPLPCKTPTSGSVKAPGPVNPLSSAEYEFEYHPNATQNQTLNGPFVLNGNIIFTFLIQKQQDRILILKSYKRNVTLFHWIAKDRTFKFHRRFIFLRVEYRSTSNSNNNHKSVTKKRHDFTKPEGSMLGNSP